VRDNATVVYLTNEKELGDFGVGGITFKTKQGLVTSEKWMGGLFEERGIKVIDSAHVTKVDPGKVHYEQIDGTVSSQVFDFAMLLPPFRGANLTAFDAKGKEITDKLFMPNNFMKVDANYEVKPFAQWTSDDWPVTYQSPEYSNMFAAGIAFAPPHAISEPHQTPSGAPVAPAPPRTGMPSGVQGRAVAETIAERILTNNPLAPAKEASMGEMGAACIASVGVGMLKGEAASIVMSPIVPNFAHFPETGRDLGVTTGELGLAGHWIKRLLHTMFIYKAKAYPGWALIPE
jgi:sulfide:quinone oxidoreductase